jgi:uncharacterized Fe-S cluster protein YjdI/CDGSH-type Zn-finger protein
MDTRGKAYTAPDITVYYDPARCIHAAECVRGLPAVFDTSKRPWVQPGNAPAAEVATVIRRCPSGALRYHLADGADESPETPTTLRLLPDGRLEVRGDLRIAVADGASIEAARATLCTCGRSHRLPFCDNAHLAGAGEAATAQSERRD